MALQEMLADLSQRVPDLVPEIAALLEEAARLEQAVQELLGDFEEKRQAAQGLAERARQALGELRDAGAHQGRQLEVALASLETAVHGFAQGLHAAEDGLAAGAQAADAAMDALAAQLAGDGSTARQAHEAGEAAVGGLGEGMETGLQELRAAFEAAAARADALGQAVADAHASAAEEVAGLRQTMAGLLESARTAVGDTLADVRSRQSAHDGTLQGAMGDLAAGKDALVSELRDRLRQEAQSRVDAALEDATLALDALADEARGAIDTVAVAGQQLESGVEDVQQVMSPLPGAVQQVKVAAERVGLRWG